MQKIDTMEALAELDEETPLILTNHPQEDRAGVIANGQQVRLRDGETMVFSNLPGTPALPVMNLRAAVTQGRLWAFESNEDLVPRLERGQWYQSGQGYYIGILEVLPENTYTYVQSNPHDREIYGTWRPRTEVLDYRTHTHLARPAYAYGAALSLMVQREDAIRQEAERAGMVRLRDALAEDWDHESYTEGEINEVLDKFALDHMPPETEVITVTVDVSGYYDLPSGFRMQGEITGVEVTKTVEDGECGCHDVTLDDIRAVVGERDFEPDDITERECENC